MGYLSLPERDQRLSHLRKIMAENKLDMALVYYDEFNIGNGWYLTGWCPQFESGAILVPKSGEPMVLGGPESEPFAKLDSAITETRNFPVFMVPDEEYPNATIIDFPTLFEELNAKHGAINRVGMVGCGRMPAECHQQFTQGFSGVEIVDITDNFCQLRYMKSPWEMDQIKAAFKLADDCYEAMKNTIAPGVTEIAVAAAGEFAARKQGASGFGFSAIVGSGKRGNAVVPTASSKILESGEVVMLGLAPKVQGYAGVFGHTLPVSGEYTPSQNECMKHLSEAYKLTREQLVCSKKGSEVDAPARAYFEKHNLSK
jgi:Xaa-Pro aminopeptidase